MLILHGTNHVASRETLTDRKKQAREKGIEVVNLAGKDLDLTKLKQVLESASLFGGDRLVVIENLFSLPKSKLKEQIINYLKSELDAKRPDKVEDPRSKDRDYPLNTELIIWEGKQIDGRILKGFANKARIQAFKLPAVVFKFLDALAPENVKETLILLHQTLETEPAELVFYLLARRIRFLIIAKDLGRKGLTKMAPWQQGRLVYQAEKFKLDQLLRLHKQLLKIDWEQKTGRASLPLAPTLDLLIMGL